VCVCVREREREREREKERERVCVCVCVSPGNARARPRSPIPWSQGKATKILLMKILEILCETVKSFRLVDLAERRRGFRV
jgi:hypothetical protein